MVKLYKQSSHLMYRLIQTATLLLLFPHAAATIHIQAPKTNLDVGEPIQITITSDKGTKFDVSQLQPLLQYFDVLGQSQSEQYQSINGKQSRSFSLNLRLSPKKQGTFNIPAMLINNEQSNPLTFRVKANSAVQPAGQTIKNFEIIGSVDTPKTYVGTEIIYTLKLLYRYKIVRGQISQPQISGLKVKTIVKEKRSKTVYKGQNYEVLEWRYAFIPKRSEQLKIAPLFFDGTVVVPSGQRHIRINSQEVNVTVRPIPTSWPTNKNWIPAKSLSLWEKWQPAANQWQAGNPVSRSIEIEALGIEPSQIGKIEIGNVPNVNTYPQQPIRNLKLTPDGHLARFTFTVDYIATTATTLTLPEISIPWWDMQANSLRYASLPARQIQVGKGTTGISPTTPIQLNIPKANTGQPVSSVQPLWGQVWGQGKTIVFALVVFLFLYTLLTIALTTRYQRYQRNKPHKPRRLTATNPLSQQLQKSYKNKDSQQLKHLLLISYRQYQYQFTEDIKQRWQNQIHYLSSDNPMDKERLEELISQLKALEKPAKKVKRELPHLYPH